MNFLLRKDVGIQKKIAAALERSIKILIIFRNLFLINY